MPDLSLLVDLSNFYSIRQQTAFNLVQIKHTALLLHDFFFMVSFFISSTAYILKGKSCFTRSRENETKSISQPGIQLIHGGGEPILIYGLQ